MRRLKNIGILFVAGLFLTACTESYDFTDEYDDTDYFEISVPDPAGCPCADNHTTVAPSYQWNGPQAGQTIVRADGVRVCPPHKRCPDDGRLPPQPCAQPMPTYYGNVSSADVADGIVLIHPYTRTQVICFDKPNQSASDCAQNFKASGYVLITDLPQLPARYDFLKDGTYPTRRWRGGGEVVPRW